MVNHQVGSAWAKFDRASEDWMSLIQHSEDAVSVAGRLWDEWLPASTKRVLQGDASNTDARRLGQFLSGTHDVGKLSPAFAMQVDMLCGRMRDANLRFPPIGAKPGEAPHSVISHVAIADYLVGKGYDQLVARSYACVAGGHHGSPPALGQVGLRAAKPSRHYGDSAWAEARSALIDHIVGVVGARTLIDTSCRANALRPEQQVLWTAFVIMADWIASNADLFPLAGSSVPGDRGATGWSALGFPLPWRAAPPANPKELLQTRFELPPGSELNTMQRSVFDVATNMERPGLIVIEATMGSGKTEAALLAAEYLAHKFGQGGVFVALPTMATSNAMFSRVRTWLSHQLDSDDLAIQLAHGKSHLNEAYSDLTRLVVASCVGIDESTHSEIVPADVVVHQWFSGRKRAMLAPFVVGTIDQLLFTALKSKHVVLRHLALANKVVIVDEVHAADTYMRHYLVRVLEWLGVYDVPVIVMSATLPGHQRVELIEAYERGAGWSSDGPDVAQNTAYPVVTSTSGSHRQVATPRPEPSHSVEITRLPEDDHALVEFLRAQLASGGCVAIVRNTVRRAQECARLLRAEFDTDVLLLHSRFAARHRADLEAQLMRELGRTGARPQRRIVVATQVIEQSLDVDFDLLITDLAPIDAILQRMGRLHRHHRARPADLSRPRVVLTGVDDWSANPIEPERGLVAVYGAAPLLRSAAVLKDRREILVPADIPTLVGRAYDPDLTAPTGWAEVMAAADVRFDAHAANQRARADMWRLGSPNGSPNLVDWLDKNVGDADGARGQAKVRDSDVGVEVLLTRRVGGEVYLLEQCGGARIPTEYEPSFALTRRVLDSSVQLPRELCRTGAIVDATIGELEGRMYIGWAQSRWLAGELVIELDEQHQASVGGYRLTYDAVYGLEATKEVAA